MTPEHLDIIIIIVIVIHPYALMVPDRTISENTLQLHTISKLQVLSELELISWTRLFLTWIIYSVSWSSYYLSQKECLVNTNKSPSDLDNMNSSSVRTCNLDICPESVETSFLLISKSQVLSKLEFIWSKSEGVLFVITMHSFRLR
jgi:hypothetical protein